MSKVVKIIFCIGLIIILIGGIIWKNSGTSLEDHTRELLRVWKGDQKVSQCSQKIVWSEHKRCNPEIVKCFLKTQKDISSSWEIRGIPEHERYEMMVTLKKYGRQKEVFLKDACRDVYLEKRVFGVGSFKKSDDIIWDNFNQKIFIDKFLVTNRDVIEWAKLRGIKEVMTKKREENLYLPATHLTREQMKDFCFFRRKIVAQAHIWDAASFLPINKDPKQKPVLRFENSWSKFREDSFLYMSRKKKIVLKKEHCHRAYVSGCEKEFPYSQLKPEDTSWVGMSQILGGVMEYTEDIFFPKRNLKISSYYFPAKSLWHQIGERGTWDGEGFSDKNVKLIGRKDDSFILGKDLDISFRCMRFE